jgi:cell division septation protein DedD
MHAWKNADNAAKLEDQLLSAKFDAYLAQQGPLPAEEDRLKLQRLRQEANEKLAAAIAYLKNRS